MTDATSTPVADSGGAAGGSSVLPGRTKVERKYVELATPQMEGETPQVVFRGKTGMSVVLLLVLLIPLNVFIALLWVLITRPRLVIVTDRRVHIFVPGSVRKPPTKLAMLDRPAQVELTRYGLRLGDQKIYALLGEFGGMKQAAELAQQRPD